MLFSQSETAPNQPAAPNRFPLRENPQAVHRAANAPSPEPVRANQTSNLFQNSSPVPTLTSPKTEHPSAAPSPAQKSPLKKISSLSPVSSQPVSPRTPALWVEIPDSPYLTPAQQTELQADAEALAETLNNSGLTPGTPEYNKFRDDIFRDSDYAFRARYGQRAWLEHHLQAHQTGAGSGK